MRMESGWRRMLVRFVERMEDRLVVLDWVGTLERKRERHFVGRCRRRMLPPYVWRGNCGKVRRYIVIEMKDIRTRRRLRQRSVELGNGGQGKGLEATRRRPRGRRSRKGPVGVHVVVVERNRSR